MRKIFLFAAALLCSANLFADQLIGGINYSLDDEKLEATVVAKGQRYSGDVTIPATVEYDAKTYNVVEIGVIAFKDCVDMTSITLSEGLKTIGYGAFWNCDKLTTVAIPSTVTKISGSAFEDCNELAEFTLPNTVTDVGLFMFDGDNKLTQPVYNNTFFAYMPNSDVGDYTIPDGITTILARFKGCTELTSFTMPNSVEWMISSAFEDCDKLESVTLSENLYNIEASTFGGCIKLQSVTIPASVTEIGEFAFIACSELASVTLKEGLQKIGTGAFAGCAFTSITFPSTLQSIASDAFTDCNELTEVVLPEGLTSIREYAFEGCDKLHKVTLPSTLTELPYSFLNCSALDTMIVNMATPLDISADMFDGVNIASCKLFVPAGSVTQYTTADVWKDFDVQPISNIPTALDNTAADTKAIKRLVNGQLLIEKNGKIYNALGVEVK